MTYLTTNCTYKKYNKKYLFLIVFFIGGIITVIEAHLRPPIFTTINTRYEYSCWFICTSGL